MVNKRVAIVIPTHRSALNADDLTSLRHLEKYLGKFPRYFVIPDKVDPKNFNQKKAKFIKFSNHYFSSWRGYNELLLQKDFYLKFKDYEYILIYQLDVLVFSDKLLHWCDKGYDYVAAPWYRPVIGWLSNKKGMPASGGNGGFSLRKVKSAIKVLNKVERLKTRHTANGMLRKLWFFKALLTGKLHDIWLNAPADNYPFAEDGFWSIEAPKYIKNYRVPAFNDALEFAFERFPKRSFILNNRRLPFGVHAWKKYDGKFWKTFILKDTTPKA